VELTTKSLANGSSRLDLRWKVIGSVLSRSSDVLLWNSLHFNFAHIGAQSRTASQSPGHALIDILVDQI